ncbi:hypothetical protein ACH5RR_032415 [Cinchona calisaya]|uniref:Uncharacterized protein n=1 Tax=Cinchona calisaya TaxID=153742 RepID=A0ABD2YNA8_9GENT
MAKNSGECCSCSCGCGAKKLKCKLANSDSEVGRNDNLGLEKKLSRENRLELGRLFQGAQDLHGITRLIRKIIGNGAYDFTRAILRTSLLASCVSACQSQKMIHADTVTVMAQSFHFLCQGNEYRASYTVPKIQIQLSTFKTFLDLAGKHLTGKDFTEAFDAACFPLTLFASSFDPRWASSPSTIGTQGLLVLLIDSGADSVNQWLLQASRFGSTELVRNLLQIALRNSLDIDVDLASGFASHYGKMDTMECLVEEGNAMAFLGPLMRAAERGCTPVVQRFVRKGCRDMELCLSLTAATSCNQVEVAAYLLPHAPKHVLAALSIEILKVTAERSGGSLDGVSFLLRSDFLDNIARSNDKSVAPEMRAFLQEHWSEAAFLLGLRQVQEHHVNLVRIIKWGESPICLRDLPGALRVAIAYLPLYRKCLKAGGSLLSQRLRGQLVDAVRRLGCMELKKASHRRQLLVVLEHHLPSFLVNPS